MHLDADSQREACGTLLGCKDDVFKVGGAVDRVLLCGEGGIVKHQGIETRHLW